MNEREQQAQDLFYADCSQYHLPLETQAMLIASADTWRERYDNLVKYLQRASR